MMIVVRTQCQRAALQWQPMAQKVANAFELLNSCEIQINVTYPTGRAFSCTSHFTISLRELSSLFSGPKHRLNPVFCVERQVFTRHPKLDTPAVQPNRHSVDRWSAIIGSATGTFHKNRAE